MKAWILATRPATLTVGLIPVLVGCAIARSMHALRICPALAALFGAIFIQIGTNLANDVFDYERGRYRRTPGSAAGHASGSYRAAQRPLGNVHKLCTGDGAGALSDLVCWPQ